jgi:hypothetical protein
MVRLDSSIRRVCSWNWPPTWYVRRKAIGRNRRGYPTVAAEFNRVSSTMGLGARRYTVGKCSRTLQNIVCHPSESSRVARTERTMGSENHPSYSLYPLHSLDALSLVLGVSTVNTSKLAVSLFLSSTTN